MPWRGETRATCKVCGKPRQPGELFSARGMHIACGDQRRAENLLQLHEGVGPYHEHWARKCFMAAHRKLIDAERARMQTAD